MAIKRDKVDALFSKFIKLLSDGYCKRCGKYLGVKSRGLHCAHYKSRGIKTTRWDRANAQALCYGCHRYIDHNPLIKAEFFLEILGQEEFNALNWRADHPVKVDVKAIETDLKEKIKKLEVE